MINFILLFLLGCGCLFVGYWHGYKRGQKSVEVAKELAERIDDFNFEHLENVVRLLRKTGELSETVMMVSNNVASMIETVIQEK